MDENGREWTRIDKNERELTRIDKNGQELTRIGTSYPKIATNFKSFFVAEIFALLK